MLSLTSSNEQTTAVPLTPNEDGIWQAAFSLPDTVTDIPLLAEFRVLPSGSLAVVQLGEAPRLIEQLQIEIAGAWWDGEREQITMILSVHNPEEGAVYLGSEFIQIPERYEVRPEGGDAYEVIVQVTPRLPGQGGSTLPMLIEPGKTLGLAVTFPWHAPSVRLQIGADLWEVADVPLDIPASTGQQPVNGGG
jgi:hypothetical protein